tara:strand:+ start:234 stop:1082 length:849 start_codon:yes stop_codon:yes gene_type:complete
MFSIVIPTFNNLEYLRSTIKSLKKNSTSKYEIIVHVNDGSDGTKDYLKSEKISFSWSQDNIGLCSAINAGVKLTNYKYIIYSHDDCYFCPSWDKVLIDEINKLNHNKFYFSCSLIEHSSGHIKFDCGKDLESFNEDRLLKNYKNINFYDHQGSHWSPLCVHLDMWNKIGGFSEEFNPGIGSDPDFNMKLWNNGVRIFKGLNDFKVYHFASLTTRKNIKVIQNRGDNTFLKKWGFSIKFFKRFYMRTNEKYDGPLNEPNKNILFYFYLLICKIKFFYVYLLRI